MMEKTHYQINPEKIREKLQTISKPQGLFALGAIDHSPQEIIFPGQKYTSSFIIYDQFFHKNFKDLNIRLSKWSSSGKNYKKQFYKRWHALQCLPFFAYISTASGDSIHNLFNHYINTLGLKNRVKPIVLNGEKYHRYYVYEKDIIEENYSFQLKENISMGALHIAFFIIKSYFAFKKFSEDYNINFSWELFQVYHDNFPSNHEQMSTIVYQLIRLSQYYGYSTRVISLCRWDTPYEMADDLLADNLAGLFRAIAENKYNQSGGTSILDSNASIISWTELISC